MMVLKELATAWAEALSRVTGETDRYKIDLARYMLESLLSTLLSILFVIIFGLLFGVIKTAFLISLTVAVLKSFTGGLHLSTPLRCALTGAVMAIIFSFIALYIPFSRIPKLMQLWFLIIAIYIVWRQAPLEAKGKPLSIGQKQSLARNSRIIILLITAICWCWPQSFGVNELFYGTIFQVLNLTKPMALALAGLDRVLDRWQDKFQGIVRI